MEQKNNIEGEASFVACEHLDFSDKFSAKKELIATKHGNKVCWNRQADPSLPSLVQFCKLRGRLNTPESCLSKESACCHEYNDYSHHVKNITQ